MLAFYVFYYAYYLDLVVISLSPVSSIVSPKGSVTGCDSSLGREWMFFHFRLVKSVLFFVNYILLCFSISYIVLTCYVYFFCISFLTRSSPVSSQDFYCSLLRNQSRDVTPLLGVCVIFQCTSFRVHKSYFRLLLLRLCIVISVLRPLW